MKTRFKSSIYKMASLLIAMTFLWQLPAKATDTAALGNAFDSLHWISYSPLHYNPESSPQVQPSKEDLEADLTVLKNAGFGGVVTYGCMESQATLFPEVASKLGFKIIIGIWDPNSPKELDNAVAAAKNPNVLAVCVGNEGLLDKHNMSKRYTLAQLTTAINNVRSRTGKPVTTSQQAKSYSEQPLIDICDFLFPTIHPYWEGDHEGRPELFNPIKGGEWTVGELQTIRSRGNGKITVAKEVGYPTGGCKGRCNEQTQSEYYVYMTQSPMRKAFCYFEAYDQAWKQHNDTEPYWGLYYGDRRPKPAMAAIKAVW
jgi:exo-beta-1,3-glucanase (GH17 family)